eukprot:evm.model.scf_473.2 EVM.evm.TU.scf_473.2   scf_473:2551-3700(-)
MEADRDPPSHPVAQAGPSAPGASYQQTSADYYFDSYSHFGIHEEMLKDRVRTRGYMQAICNNPHLFKGKTVLDVGCGTGILSLFCAKAGAAAVYGIECSAIADQAVKVVEDNGYSDTVTIVKGKVEEVELPCGQVDVIVSEWMGYFLFYESMLDTVIFARDKWLAPDGVMMPDRATLCLVAIEDGDYKHEKIDFWQNVYGFDMRCIRELAILEPLVDTVEPEQVNTTTCKVREVDLRTIQKAEVEFSAPFQVTATRNDYIHALVAYFDVAFTACHKPVVISTSPKTAATHWKQAVFYLEDTIMISQGEAVSGVLTCKQNQRNKRDLDVTVEYHFEGKHGSCDRTQKYKIR